MPVIGNALYYQWELPAGAVITAGDSTNNVLVTFSGASQSGVVRVKGTNPCGDGIPSPDFSVTVTDAIPAQLTVADTIIPGQTICFNATQTITVAGAGTTFLVENGGDAALIAGENIVFLEGTTIQEGGHLWAWITTTADYCAANFPAMVTAVAKETETAPETPSQPSISVYPNPTDDKFILSCNSPGTGFPVRITIYNMTGKRVAEEILTGTIQKEFSLVRQPSGIYILHAASGHGSEMVKIIRK